MDIILGRRRERNNNGKNDNIQEGAQSAVLSSPMPRTLHIFWAEWTKGIGGRKLAYLFTVD